ncbi:MAG: metallophosphoesterase family protein, partial [Burkholderiales bacterium]
TAYRLNGDSPHFSHLAFPLLFLLSGCAQLAPLPEGQFVFGVLGDTPYSETEVRRLDDLIGRINAHELAFVVHVGDVGTSARTQGCSDTWLEARKRQFERIQHPFILLPGDNEWSDCVHHGLDPRERLAVWRRLFCADAAGLALERQPGHCENVRWHAGGIAFIGLNVPGGGSPDLGDARMRATYEWLDESLALAEQRGAGRIVVFMHADPRFERAGDGDAYARLRAVLATHASWFRNRLVLVHGDTHMYRDDEPLRGLRRLEPWGSPFVSWLRVTLDAGVLRVAPGR